MTSTFPPANDSHDPATAKRDLRSWWKGFRNREKQEQEKQAATTAPPPPSPGIFGVPLQTSIQYAHVAISLLDADGKSFTYGYVPIVVAKCGVFLKEKATEIEGIFRLAGAERRIKELQATFNSPEKYGKGLDWTGYTVHDAANVLRRYCNQLPEPIIPLSFYEKFRDPIRGHQAQAVGDMGDQQQPSVGDFDRLAAIKTFQRLITEIPPLNRQLLLYILDLLAVFASKSDMNHMNAPNLATIFQPGLLSHPNHSMSPAEYRLSQDVLIFLVDNQDHFLVGMQGTAADEKTIQEVSSGAAAVHRPAGSTESASSRQRSFLGRSASNASAGADSLRKFGGIRRNVSTSSKRSRQSGQTPSPVTPPPESPYSRTGGVYRSNTVPSKKSQSPSIGTARFEREKSTRRSGQSGRSGITGVAIAGVQQPQGPPTQVPPRESSTKANEPTRQSRPTEPAPRQRPTQPKDKEREPERLSPHLRPVKDRRTPSSDRALRMDLPPSVFGPTSPATGTSPRERPLSNYFGHRSPSADPAKDGRKPNKLQKRRVEGGATLGTKHSNPSFSGTSHPPSPATMPHYTSPRQTAVDGKHDGRHLEPPWESIEQMTEPVIPTSQPPLHLPQEASRSQPDPKTSPEGTIKPEAADIGPQRSDTIRHAPTAAQTTPFPLHLKDMPNRDSSSTIKPNKSPTGSQHSQSMTGDELSSRENTDTEPYESQGLRPKKEKKHSRWRLSTSARKDAKDNKTSTSPNLGHTQSSFGGSTDADRSTSSVGSYGKLPRKSFTDDSKDSAGYITAGSEPEGASSEKRGPFGWLKGKMQERKEREAEKERAKSPPPSFNRIDPGHANRSIDAAMASGEGAGHMRGRSFDGPADERYLEPHAR